MVTVCSESQPASGNHRSGPTVVHRPHGPCVWDWARILAVSLHPQKIRRIVSFPAKRARQHLGNFCPLAWAETRRPQRQLARIFRHDGAPRQMLPSLRKSSPRSAGVRAPSDCMPRALRSLGNSTCHQPRGIVERCPPSPPTICPSQARRGRWVFLRRLDTFFKRVRPGGADYTLPAVFFRPHF